MTDGQTEIFTISPLLRHGEKLFLLLFPEILCKLSPKLVKYHQDEKKYMYHQVFIW